MKKLPISLFAIASIILAISSAFTTATKPTDAYKTFQVWAILNDTTYVNDMNESDSLENDVPPHIVLADNGTPFNNVDGNNDYGDELEYMFDQQSFPYMPKDVEEITCPASGDRACIAYIDAKKQIVLAMINGEYTPEGK